MKINHNSGNFDTSIKSHCGMVYWITGLSGSGKTTVAKYFFDLLISKGYKALIIDGDDLRQIIKGGFSKKERTKQAKKYSKLCKLFSEQGIIVIAAVGALVNSIQKWNRLNIKNYVEVFLNVPLEELESRNKKNLYTNFKEGKVNNIVGLDIKADFPEKPDIEVKNYGQETSIDSAKKIYNFHKNFENIEKL